MTNLDTIPAPGPDCTAWRTVTPNGHGHYRRFAGRSGIQFAYPDGQVLTLQDWDADL